MKENIDHADIMSTIASFAIEGIDIDPEYIISFENGVEKIPPKEEGNGR